MAQALKGKVGGSFPCVIMEGDRVFKFDVWRNFMVYWKRDLQYKETIKSFLSNSHPQGTTAAFVGSDDDAMKLETIYFVESVLMGKRKNKNVSEQIMKIPNENETEKDKDKDKDSYTILGFPFAFCVWIMERLSESFKKDLQAEVTRINQKIVVAEKKIENEIMFTTKCPDAHLEDETENVTDIGKESIDGEEVQDVGECQDQKNPKETGVTEKNCKCGLQSQEDLESLLGTSVSEIVCKCLEGTYDLSTPLSYKEKFRVQTCANQESFEAVREETGVEYQEKSGVQSQDLENTERTSISEIVSKFIDGTCDLPTPPSLTDNIGTQENASEDNDVIGMILTIANESCELATEEHGEQLQDKENVQLEDKKNDASNILAELSLEKTQ
ncbi:uncharacterized protein [Nicotiana sylvestris]|uniref:uncharacterized protein n=1 Tax=Nicotiana sylvestris TaxID=4096 RepID=UPI00388C6A8B